MGLGGGGGGGVEDFQIFSIVALQQQVPHNEVQPNRSLSTSVAWIIPVLIRTLQFRIVSERHRQRDTDRDRQREHLGAEFGRDLRL